MAPPSRSRRRRQVLVTGANGYIGAQAIATFLREGWTVRGAVRDLSSISARELASHFAVELSAGTFELVSIPNIKEEGAFDEAVRGVTAIAHLATPVVFDSGDVEYVVGTAVRGTLSILESALRASSGTSAGYEDRDEPRKENGDADGEEEEQLKSFVFMSSASAVRMRVPDPVTFTEADWNTQAEAEVKEAGDSAFGHVVYAVSKVAAERALWDWVREKKPPFAATALCPCWVGGPPAYLPSSAKGIAESTRFIWQIFSGENFPEGPAGYGTYVDVRDVARMTEWAASNPEVSGGERYIVGGNGNVGVPQAAADILREAYPERRHIIKPGAPGKGYLPGCAADPREANVNSSKAVNATSQAWIPYHRMVLDAAKMFEALL